MTNFVLEVLYFVKSPISFYGFFLLLYLYLQIRYAILEKNKQKKLQSFLLKDWPFVSVLLPFYNESKKEIEETINSLISMDYPSDKIEILVIDDGSENIETYIYLINKYHKIRNVKFFYQKNLGKRESQVKLFYFSDPRAKYFLTVDSDTIFDKQCLKELVKVAEYFGVQGVSGGILVKNGTTVLNLLLRTRYWIANWQERLSQSWFDQVACCSGPCSLWDKKVFEKVKDKYINQIFNGQKCTYGDDRHLTNLYLEQDCKIKMADKAYCYTSIPETWKKWIKQQERWSKSFYRESIWSFNNLRGKAGWFFIYQNSMSFILPFLLIFNVLFYSVTKTIGIKEILFYILSITIAGLIRGIYAYVSTKDKTYFLAPIYGFVHFIIVFPIRIYSIFKMGDIKWGTR